MHVRAATAQDNEKLIAIEQRTPQGEQIKLVSERKDYFIRAKKFEEPILLVAEDKDIDDILGIMGVGPVSVTLRGKTVRGGLVFDWRSNPLAQKGLPRHMLRLWQAAQTEIARQKLEFIFGYVKEDNERSLGILKKYGAQAVETKEFLTMPVHARFSKASSQVNQVAIERTLDTETERAVLEDYFGSLDLFPDQSQLEFASKQQEHYMFGKFSYGKSSVKVWDTNDEYSQRVLNMPLLYKVVRPIFGVGSKIFPLPRIPRLGDQIRVWQLYDLILHEPGDLDYLLERVRLAAKEENIDYLVVCMNSKDRGYEQVSKKAWVRLKYHLFFLPLVELPLPQEPTYFDVSYL